MHAEAETRADRCGVWAPRYGRVSCTLSAGWTVVVPSVAVTTSTGMPSLSQPKLARQRLARTELTGLDLVAQQVRELAEDGAVGRRIDHASHRTWPRCPVPLYVQIHVGMLPPPR